MKPNTETVKTERRCTMKQLKGGAWEVREGDKLLRRTFYKVDAHYTLRRAQKRAGEV